MNTFGELLEYMGSEYRAEYVLGSLRGLDAAERKHFINWCHAPHRSVNFWFMSSLRGSFDMTPVCKQVVDRDYVTTKELLQVCERIRAFGVEQVFDLFEEPLRAHTLLAIRRQHYHLPSTSLARPDWYASNLASVPPARLQEAADALESGATDMFAVQTHFAYQNTHGIPCGFMVNTLGLKNFTERDLLLCSWAFTKVHVKDGWAVTQRMFNNKSIDWIADVLQEAGRDVENIIAYTIRTIQKEMGLGVTKDLTPMSVVEREVSPRLFRTINKAAFFEDLIDPSNNTIKPSTSSVELVEELCAYCRGHGYESAEVGWAPKKGVTIFLDGRVKNA